MSDNSWFLYVIRCKDNSLYTGVTTDISRRVREHSSESKGAKYTRSRGPFDVVYCERCIDRSAAQKKESAFKKLSKKEKEKKVSIYLLEKWYPYESC